MGRLTRLTGGTMTAAEGGRGKRLGLLALAGIGLLVALRLRGGDDPEDDGIDTIRTDDPDDEPETVRIGDGEGEGEDGDEEAADGVDADGVDADAGENRGDEAEADDGDEEEGEVESGGISVEAIDRRDLDLFDIVAIVGEGLRAAREEYDRRAS